MVLPMRGVTVTLNELLALRHVADQLHLPQKRTQTLQQGGDLSALRSRGIDFLETRIYQPGDDIRKINWAVTARTGKPHTKIYQEERARSIYLLIDFSPSLFFGTRNAFKSVVAAEVATLIAWAVLKKGDRLGALLIKNNTFKLLSACQRKRSLVELLQQLVNFVEPSDCEVSDYLIPFQSLKRLIQSGSLVYFLSDFYLMDEFQKQLQQLARNSEVINILLYDELEKHPPKRGHYLFHDTMNSDSLLIDTHSRSLCSQYSAILHNRLLGLKKLCFTTGMSYIAMSTKSKHDVMKVVRQILNWRKI
jgi:uncharacterized protein (DUF58 family)